jgi:hypothetical protein
MINDTKNTELDNAEQSRLEESRRKEKHWKKWGPYLSERAWGTVREDYSAEGPRGTHFHTITHDLAHTVGMKTVWVGFVITTKIFVSRWLFGMAMIRS